MMPSSPSTRTGQSSFPPQNTSIIVTKDERGEITIKEIAGAWYKRFGQILKAFFFENKGCKVYFLNKSIARITLKFIGQTDLKDIGKIQQTSTKVSSLKGRISKPLTQEIEKIEKKKEQYEKWEAGAKQLFEIENKTKYIAEFSALYNQLYSDLAKPIREKIVDHLLKKLNSSQDLNHILKLINDPRLSPEDRKKIAQHFLPAIKQQKIKEQEQLIKDLKGFDASGRRLVDEVSALEEEREGLKAQKDPIWATVLPKLSLPARTSSNLTKYREEMAALREKIERNEGIDVMTIPEQLEEDIASALRQAQHELEILLRKKGEFRGKNYLQHLQNKKDELARLIKNDDLAEIGKALGATLSDEALIDALYDENITEEKLQTALRPFEESQAELIGKVKADSRLAPKQQLQHALRLIIDNRKERIEVLKQEIKADELLYPGFYEMELAEAEQMLKDYVQKHEIPVEVPTKQDLIQKLNTLQKNTARYVELRQEARAILELAAVVKEKRANADQTKLFNQQLDEVQLAASSLQELSQAIGEIKGYQKKEARLGEIDESLEHKLEQQKLEEEAKEKLVQQRERLGEQLAKIVKLEKEDGRLSEYLAAIK